MSVTSDFTDDLRQPLIHRRIAESRLRAFLALEYIRTAKGTDLHRLIKLLADVVNVIDFDPSLRDLVHDALKSWPESSRGALLHRTVLLLQFTDSVVAMHKEDFETAAVGLQPVIQANETAVLSDPELHWMAVFYKARCRYYQAQYDASESLCNDARKLGHGLDVEKFRTAVIDILHSRIILKTKPVEEAIGLAPIFDTSS